MLKHFTEEQNREIHAELHFLLRPYRVRFYSVLIGFLIMLSIGAYGYQSAQSNAAYDNCMRAARDRKPFVVYIGQVLLLTATAHRLHLIPNAAPPLQKLQNKEIHSLRVLYQTLKTTEKGCPS